MKLYQYIIALCFLCFVSGAYAQVSTSPYSIYGLGELNSNLSGKNHAMGGTGYARSSDHYLNNLNPASLKGIDSLEFLMEFGTSFQMANYSTNGASRPAFKWNFNYLAFGFRLKKWWHANVGIAPYSTVGYYIKEEYSVEGGNENYSSIFSGEGGVDKVYLGQSFSLNDKLSLGVSLNYLFGSIQQKEDIYAQSFATAVQVQNKDYFNNLTFDLGLQYTFLRNTKSEMTLGLLYSPKRKFKTDYKKYIYDSNSKLIFADSSNKSDYSVPHTLGIGLNYNKFNKFSASIDYTYQDWESTDYSIQNKEKLVNSHRFAIGGEYLPNPVNPRSLWQASAFRFGAFYQKNYLSVKKENLNSYGFSVGMGVPIRKGRSLVHVTYEFERRGTTNKGLIMEDLHNISINMSLNDLWFMKRKYD